MSLKFTDKLETLSFSGATTTITDSFAGQTGELILLSRAQLMLLVNHTSGDETSLELLLEFSPSVTRPVAVPATGVDYYVTSTVALGGTIAQDVVVLDTTGKYRIPFPLVRQERIMRISVKRTGGTDAGAGSVVFKVVDDSQQTTSALTGRQP